LFSGKGRFPHDRAQGCRTRSARSQSPSAAGDMQTGKAMMTESRMHARAVVLAEPLTETVQDLPRRPPQEIGPGRLGLRQGLFLFDLVSCLIVGAILTCWSIRFLEFSVATLGLLALLHLYRRRLSLSVLDDLPYLLLAVAGADVLSLALATAQGTGAEHMRLLLQGALLAVVLVCLRGVAFAVARRMRRRGLVHNLGLIIGAGHVGIRLARNLQNHSEYGVTPVGFIDVTPRVGVLEELPAPLLGGYDELSDVIEDFNISHVIVAFGSMREVALVDVLRTCDRLECEIFFVPRLFELHQTTRDMDEVWGIPLIRVRRAAFRSFSWRVKRLLDVLVAATALIAFSPVIAVCALLVRLEGGPGILFRQDRVGLDGRPFQILKFRSLRPADDSESQVLWNISQDHRVGPVGRFLRATSLDELPQLWNILDGGMSLVGPRPERPHFVTQFASLIPRYTARHRVPSGLTGWAQVHGLRGDTSIEDRASFDNYYIENWSLWGDIKIALRTIGQVARRAGG
jgi:exopolysaccharide biosynthesis polyprenyl glycosylphosphotransferase